MLAVDLLQDFFMEIDVNEFGYEVSSLVDRCMTHVTSMLKEALLTTVSDASGNIHQHAKPTASARSPGHCWHVPQESLRA